VLVIGYGEAWMLAQPRGDEPEVTAATYAAEAVYGESAPDAN
jgi:hypothetical protein